MGNVETRIEHDDDGRMSIVATYDGEEASQRVGRHVAKMSTEEQRWHLKKAQANAIHKVLKKVQKKRLEQHQARAILAARR